MTVNVLETSRRVPPATGLRSEDSAFPGGPGSHQGLPAQGIVTPLTLGSSADICPRAFEENSEVRGG